MSKTTRREFTTAGLLAAPALLLRAGSASAQLTEMPPVAGSEAARIAFDA